MGDEIADLRSYYEEEARRKVRGPLRGRRVELRSEFVQLLLTEGRCAVVDYGAGPGFDAAGFTDAGLSYVGIDLAHGNGVLAAACNVTVVQSSISAPPLRPDSFDAGWSMSTLMHVPEAEVPQVVAAMTEPLASGAPLLIGLWGGSEGDVISENEHLGRQRFFSLRSFARNRELLGAAGDMERADCWDLGPDEWEYHVFLVRIQQG